MDYASPDVRNYSIPKGDLYFTPADGMPGQGVRRHLGNCPAANLALEVEMLEHFSSMEGVRTKDFSATLSKTATLTLTLEEMTRANLRLALLGGDDSTDTEGNFGFEIGVNIAISGVLEIVGKGDIGPRYHTTLYNVSITPAGGVDFIGEEIAGLELEAECNAVAGSFGRQVLLNSAVTE